MNTEQHVIKFKYTNGSVLEEGDTIIEISIAREGLMCLAHKVTTCLSWYTGENKMSPKKAVSLPIIGRIF